jgi:hypothetical protein
MTSLTCPAYLTLKTPDNLIGLCGAALAAGDSVTLEARALRFADPFGLALLGATFFMLQQRGQTVQVAGLSDAVGGYLQRMDVFEGVELVDCAPPPGQRHNQTDALVELTRLDQRSQIDRVANQLAEALVGRMPDIDPNEPCDEMSCVNTADRITIPISYALTELLNNAMSHARLKGHDDACVWVASQYYRSNGRLQLAVVDNGCGMLETLREHAALRDLPRKTDLDAILAALRPRVSCNRDLGVFSDSVNQGIGLTTTARIAEHAGGRLVIVSGAGCHDPLGQSRRLANSARWQGVAVALECQRDALLNVRIRELMPPIEGMPPLHLRFEE